MPRALLSVTDKTGIVDFGRFLLGQGFELLSTGGTAKALREAGLAVTDVSAVTGFPEMLDGRVKTLHPMVHGGLLGDRTNPAHVRQMEEAGIGGIDVVAVNLYAFEQTVSGPHELGEAVESIDIGGPAMVRASAKNFRNVLIVVDPADYGRVGSAWESGETEALRLELAAKAFRHTAFYDSMIARYLTGASGGEGLSETLTYGFRRRFSLRYGENPHQDGALYVDPLGSAGVAQAEQLWGKELSYNNILDSDGAWELVSDLPAGSCAIIKHGNPCGAAVGSTLGEAFELAKSSDPISAFGGIAAFNEPVGIEAAEVMTGKGNFLEVVIAPSFSEEALECFKNRAGWGQNVRLLQCDLAPAAASMSLRSVRGGVLVQPTDEDPGFDWRVATERAPTDEEWAALRFLWRVVPHVKSNAIVVGTGVQLLGTGAGQMNRVQSVRLAIEQAGEKVVGASLASDAFFPFPDSIETAAAAGIRSVIQPGGSVKDADVIEKANTLGVAMVLTGVRHFRH